MAFAYHMEALRRQRIIDRKHAAVARIAIMQAEQERLLREQAERSKTMKEEQEIDKMHSREEYLKSMGRTNKTKKGVINANYTHMIPEEQKRTSQKDLRHQEKILRDHCLCMGRVNEYFLA